MTKTPLVSIIVAAYNEERYISHCLSSLMNQTYKSLEIIIVDDGSTDKTNEVCKKYNVKVIKQTHAGPGRARNMGASEAKGYILCFLDGDMKYDTNYVTLLVQPIITRHAIGTFSKDEFVANPDNIWSKCFSINANLSINRHSPTNLPNRQNIYRAIRKDVFEKAKGFNPSRGYFDDTTLAEKLKTKAVGVSTAISWHFNPGNLSEIYYSARWIGRGGKYKKSIINVFRFSILNSIRVALKRIREGAPLQFLAFKIIYDIGMFQGIFLSFEKKAK